MSFWKDEIEAELQQMKAELKRSGNKSFSEQSNDDPKNLETVLEQLNNLVGMQTVKDEVNTLINFLNIQKLRQEKGLASVSITLHSVFCGPPGTGKTTVARLMGQIYKQLGIRVRVAMEQKRTLRLQALSRGRSSYRIH